MRMNFQCPRCKRRTFVLTGPNSKPAPPWCQHLQTKHEAHKMTAMEVVVLSTDQEILAPSAETPGEGIVTPEMHAPLLWGPGRWAGGG